MQNLDILYEETLIYPDKKDTADNLKKYGGFIPGIRPGENTAKYLDYVLTRLTVLGAIYLSLIWNLAKGTFILSCWVWK